MKKLRSLLVGVFFVVLCLTLFGCWGTDGDNQSSKKSVYIGESIKNSEGVEFTVLDVIDTQKIGYDTTENNFGVVKIKISNKGKEAWEQNPNNCVLLYNGAEYEYSSSTYYLNDSMSGFNEINPNITKTMSIAFEIPTKLSTGNYSIKLSGYSFFSDDSVTIILKKRN